MHWLLFGAQNILHCSSSCQRHVARSIILPMNEQGFKKPRGFMISSRQVSTFVTRRDIYAKIQKYASEMWIQWNSVRDNQAIWPISCDERLSESSCLRIWRILFRALATFSLEWNNRNNEALEPKKKILSTSAWEHMSLFRHNTATCYPTVIDILPSPTVASVSATAEWRIPRHVEFKSKSSEVSCDNNSKLSEWKSLKSGRRFRSVSCLRFPQGRGMKR